MRLFSSLKKKPEFTENVCSSEKAKQANMISALSESLSGGHITILVYHFRNNRDTALEWLGKDKIPYHEESNAYWLSELTAVPSMVNFIKSSDLRGYIANPANGPTVAADVHLMEHYPLPEKDDEILSLANIAQVQFRFIAWASLDEPLMKVFGGAHITGLMKQIGVKENEIITHPFVAKAIRNAQEKIAKKANGDSECRSSEEWFSMNFPAQKIHYL